MAVNFWNYQQHMGVPGKPVGITQGAAIGANIKEQIARERGYGQGVVDQQFYKRLQQSGVTARQTPLAFLGAYSANMLGDVLNDETRRFYWKYNHPGAIADELAQQVIDPYKQLGWYGTAAVGAMAIQPAAALTGAYNPLNIAQLGRPAGYKQNLPSEEDYKETSDPAAEIFQRFFQGRRGQPLKYEDAKKEIPTLTHGRYANYMNFLYNDPGIPGTMGTVKITGENLEGKPELRLMGNPVSIPSVTTLAGGLIGGRIGVTQVERTKGPQQLNLFGKTETLKADVPKGARIGRGIVGAATGALAGAAIGLAINEAIATANRPQLPRLRDYQQDNI
jgi:hypothetical protein